MNLRDVQFLKLLLHDIERYKVIRQEDALEALKILIEKALREENGG